MFVILRAVFILLGLLLFALLLFQGADGRVLEHGRISRAARKTACLVLIALLFLFFRGISDHGLLDPIEGINASVALNMAMRRDFATPVVDGHLYLGNSMGYWWLSALSLTVFGWSEFAVRLWSVLGGLGMAAAGWLIALRAYGERAANYTAVLIGSNLLVFATSQIASPHAFYAFCVTMSLLGAVYALRDERFFILLHVSAILAFIVYGPAGVVLPWLSLLVYAGVAGEERFLWRAFSYWPGLTASIVIGGGYLLFLKAKNPYILSLMMYNIPSETFHSASSALLLLVAGFIPWLGALPWAVRSALPLNWDFLLPNERQNLLLLVWSAVFLFFGAVSRDALLLVVPIPAIAALCAAQLAKAVEVRDSHFFQRFVSLEIVLILPFLLLGLPWFFSTGSEALRSTLMSVIPWAAFCIMFLLAGWRYARARQSRKLMLSMSMFSMFALLPLAGVFDLLGENLSVRDAGLYLRREAKPDDILFQYALNRPSLNFYVGNQGQASMLTNVPVNQKIAGQSVVGETELGRWWEGSRRVFLLIDRQQPIPNTLRRGIVYNLYGSGDKVILSNWSGSEPPPTGGDMW